MKKLFLSLFFIVTSMICFAENIPVFTDNKNAFVIDKNSFSKIPRDNIKIHASYNTKGNFEIFYYKPENETWVSSGNVELFNYCDNATLKTAEKVLRNYRYFAIVGTDEKFKYNTESRNNDLHIYICKYEPLDINGTIYDRGFCVIDYRNEDADEYIKIENCSQSSNFRVYTYVFDKKNMSWIDSGKGMLKSYGDIDTIKPNCKGDIDDYNFMAVIVENGMNFTCDFTTRNDDLYIMIISNENRSLSNQKSTDDIKTKLQNLKDCFESGLIDESEYREKRADLLKNY